jgi:hypothetical protein
MRPRSRLPRAIAKIAKICIISRNFGSNPQSRLKVAKSCRLSLFRSVDFVIERPLSHEWHGLCSKRSASANQNAQERRDVMRSKLLVSSVVGAALLTAVVGSAEGFELTEAANYSVFVPRGFDDNDEVNIVVDGFLPSSCHKLDKLNYTVDAEAQRITIQQLTRKYEGPCVQILVPFTNVLRLPPLPFGGYTVTGANGTTATTFYVAEATNAGPDDHLYAPVEVVQVNQDPGSSARYVVLEGRFTNTCMVWDEIKVIDSGKTLEVLPIIKMQDRPDCMDIDTWFKTTVNLPEKAELGRYLLHVRSLNGKSENHMFSVRPPLHLP